LTAAIRPISTIEISLEMKYLKNLEKDFLNMKKVYQIPLNF